MVDMNNLLKQAKEMKEKIEKEQKDIELREYEGQSGGNLVSVILHGNGEVKGIRIDNSLCKKDEVEILEDLITTAFNNAKKKLDEDKKDTISGLIPPGMKMPF